MTTITYPALPTLDPIAADETPIMFGLRALQFMMRTGVVAALDTETLEATLHASAVPMQAREAHPAMFEQVHDLRLQMSQILDARRKRLAAAVAVLASQPPDSKPFDGPAVPRRPLQPVFPPAATARRF